MAQVSTYVGGYFSKTAEAVGNVQPGQTPDAATVTGLQTLADEPDQTRLEHVGEWLGEQCGS